MDIQPLGDRVLVESVDKNEEGIEGGIVIPDSVQGKPQETRVIALGTGGKDEDGKDIPFDVSVGDIILVDDYTGSNVKMGDTEYRIINSSDILAIIK